MQKQVVRNQSGSAFGALISPARRRFGKSSGKSPGKASNSTPDFAERRIRCNPVKHADRMPPIDQSDTGGADPTKSSYKADLAFQRAMQSAIELGLEHPPQIGAVKDHRPLIAPRLFDPPPHSSGCTSPAFECAELVAHRDQSQPQAGQAKT